MGVDLAALKKQLDEAEAEVKRAQGIPTAEPKRKTTRQIIEEISRAHGGFAGRTLIDDIRDDIRESLGVLEDMKPGIVVAHQRTQFEEAEYQDGLIDGMCHALGILRTNDGATERQWAEAEYRETKRHESAAEKESQAQDV